MSVYKSVSAAKNILEGKDARYILEEFIDVFPAGWKKDTKFLENGSIKEIVKDTTGKTIKTKDTIFLANGNIREIVTIDERPTAVVRDTEFNPDGTITERVSEVTV